MTPLEGGGGWACAFRRLGLATAPLGGRGLADGEPIGESGNWGGGFRPHPSARSTAARVTLKQAGGYSRQPPTITPRAMMQPPPKVKSESSL